MEKPVLLCIDDDERILRSLKVLLKETHDVHVTTNPDEFLQILSDRKVHVILCDQKMPIITGTELLAKAKQVSPKTIRIILTGYAELNDVKNSINEGEVFHYMQKPWDNNEIKEVISRATKIASTDFDEKLLDSILDDVDLEQLPSKNQILYLDKNDADSLKFFNQYQSKFDVTCANMLETFHQLAETTEYSIAIINPNICENEDITTVIKKLKAAQPLLVTIISSQLESSQEIIRLINSHQIYRYSDTSIESTELEIILDEAVNRYELLKNDSELQLSYLLETANHSED